MTAKTRQHDPEDLKRIKALRLIDDDFMSIFFDGYKEGAQLLLNVFLDRNDIEVSDVRTQKEMKNLEGRSVWLDIYATDGTGNKHDIDKYNISSQIYKS